MLYDNKVLCNVGIIKTKNGDRIGSFATNSENKKVLACYLTTTEANRLIKRYSDILSIPQYRANLDK